MKTFICLIALYIVTCNGAPQYEKEDLPILKNVRREDASGNYNLDYASKTEQVQEEGDLKQLPGDVGPVSVKTGQFTFIAPNKQVYKVSYTSDERGFLAKGEHLPTPPPIPESIKQSLEFIRQQEKLRGKPIQ